MSDYIRYQHVEKLGTCETEGILDGEVYVFPKIDGTNAHVWYDGENLHFGSRRRELTLTEDNAGFMAWAAQNKSLCDYAIANKGCHIFGEWLVPHSLKTYEDSAWRNFYIFDVVYPNGETHIPYETYKQDLDTFGLSYIPPICILRNPDDDMVFQCLEKNMFLIENGKGIGEGIVLKNYEYRNKFGRQTWAKVVTNDFKAKHSREMGPPVMGKEFAEERYVEEYLTNDIIEKAYANICSECGGWSSKYIQRLLGTVYHDFVTECTWQIVKKHKSPKVDFKMINRFCIAKVKEVKPELF